MRSQVDDVDKPQEAGSAIQTAAALVEEAAPSRQSFCIPRAAINALVEARADAVVIGAYLTLACFTDGSGRYSTASVTAIRKAMSVNRDRAQKAVADLMRISVKVGATKKAKPIALLYSRDKWIGDTGEVLPDGPVERAKILHVLPDFGEDLSDRVWFGSNLVRGFQSFRLPLKRLKDAGDAAARLFLLMQQAVDMSAWGGVPPTPGPWIWYEITQEIDVSSWRIVHGQRRTPVMTTAMQQNVANGNERVAWDALEALVHSGLFYEVVLALNRPPVPRKFASGGDYGDVPPDAEPLYELDARSLHGYKPAGEEGLAGFTAKTAGELGYSVARGSIVDVYGNPINEDEAGQFTGKYAAIVPHGYRTMMAGIYRPRFRVANPKNAGVKDAWIRIHEGNREGLEWIAALRKAKKLPPLGQMPPPVLPDGDVTNG